jgi:hypothetical protein
MPNNKKILDSFINKRKVELFEVVFLKAFLSTWSTMAATNVIATSKINGTVYPSAKPEGGHGYRKSFEVSQIIYFDKKEKFFETEKEILKIQSFHKFNTENYFWSWLEQDVKIK